MNTMILRAGIFPFLAVALLTLGTVLSDAGIASAQTLPACLARNNVTPPPDPTVTAQQVEDGSATLMEFSLAVRNQISTFTLNRLEQVAYLGCLREEGSPYRSGDTYTVQLTLDGRVLSHSKDMSLAGRMLNPSVFSAVLQAVNINPMDIDFMNPASTLSALAAARMGTGGTFDVSGVAGASGYAFMYPRTDYQPAFVMLAGFDLNESHLVQETFDYTPTVTASDVVDRETLKAFVTEAGNYFVGLQQSGGLSAVSKARVALRDPNGPWRDDPVYIWILDITQFVFLFDAASPDRFELRALNRSTEDEDGQALVSLLEEVTEVARRNPEGGYVTYPSIEDPELDVTGFARLFTIQTLNPTTGETIPLEFIVGSGFIPSIAAARHSNTVIESVLPQIMRAMTASTVDAVSGRIERANSGTAPDAAVSFGGTSTLSDALLSHGQALGNGTLDLGRLLANSSFTMNLNGADGGGGPFGNLTFWGSGDYRDISGGNSQSVGYDGSVTSAHLGVDTRLGADLLGGVALMHSRGKVDYTTSSNAGNMTTDLTSVNPYLGWQLGSGIDLWAIAGFGNGEVEIDDELVDRQASDLSQRMVAAGVSGPLVSSGQWISGGTTNVNLKGEVAYTSADIDGSGSIEQMSLRVNRQRLMIEGEHIRKLDSGATFTPSLELGVRNDGGDGETGTGVEAGGGLRYADAASRLIVEGRIRTLLSHSGDYEETGVSGTVRIAPGRSGQGLALATKLSWGHTVSGVNRLWEDGVRDGESPDNQARLNTEIGYGLVMADVLGVVTPYVGLELAGEGVQWWRLGTRWQVGQAVSMSLEGRLDKVGSDDGPEHSLMLHGTLHW